MADASSQSSTRQILLETADHWEYLAAVTESHSLKPAKLPQIDFAASGDASMPAAWTAAPGLTSARHAALIASSRKHLQEIDQRIAEQHDMIARKLRDADSRELADSILESFLTIRKNVEKHLELLLSDDGGA